MVRQNESSLTIKECTPLSLCPEGTWKARPFLWIVIFGAVVFVFGIALCIWRRVNSSKPKPMSQEDTQVSIDVRPEIKKSQIDISFDKVGLTSMKS